MINETDMPFGNIQDTFKGLGTAPALESIELGEDVPVAINPDEISREATRYIWFGGNVITPNQKRERSDLRLGGEYFGQEYKTLIRSKGLVRRCQITPLEPGFNYMGEEQIGDNATNLQVVAEVTHITPERPNVAPSKLKAVQMYPGDEIKGILRGNSNGTNKGFVELTPIAGLDYAEFRKSGIQEFIFPDWNKVLAGARELPIKLSEIVTGLKTRKGETADADMKRIIEQMLVSCDTYREWGIRYLKFSSMLVKVPAHQGFVHTYSDLAEMLFIELDVRREDAMFTDANDMAAIFAKAQSDNGISGDDVKTLIAQTVETQKLLAQMLTGQAPKVEAVKEVTDEKPAVEAMPVATARDPLTGRAQPTSLDPTKCEVITAAGTQCTRDANENGRCNHPAHAKE